MIKNKKITIFLDRDGIINIWEGKYVKSWRDFHFKPNVLDVLEVFKKRGYRVIVVTNQSGVGRGVMKLRDVEYIHERMIEKVEIFGGKIDKVYLCPHVKEDNCYCKKPKPGLFLMAQRDFPDIDFKNSFMIGDWWSDMDAASILGIKTCYLRDQLTDLHKCMKEPDFCISNISQAIHLVPTFFENMVKLNKNNIKWVGNKNSRRCYRKLGKKNYIKGE